MDSQYPTPLPPPKITLWPKKGEKGRCMKCLPGFLVSSGVLRIPFNLSQSRAPQARNCSPREALSTEQRESPLPPALSAVGTRLSASKTTKKPWWAIIWEMQNVRGQENVPSAPKRLQMKIWGSSIANAFVVEKEPAQ